MSIQNRFFTMQYSRVMDKRTDSGEGIPMCCAAGDNKTVVCFPSFKFQNQFLSEMALLWGMCKAQKHQHTCVPCQLW